MEIVVVAAQNRHALSKETLEALTTALRIKKIINAHVSLWLIGSVVAAAASEAGRLNLDYVMCAEHQELKDYIAETYLEALTTLNKSFPADLILFPGDIAGSELAVRLACRMRGQSLTDCTALECGGGSIIAEKPAYSGNLSAKYRLKGKPWYLALRPNPSNRILTEINTPYALKPAHRNFLIDIKHPEFIRSLEIATRFHDDLTDAKTVVIIGAGAGSREGVGKIEQFAKKIGATVGGTRPVVQNAWLPLDLLVGQSGKIIAPNLCIVIGASGATPFLTGIVDAKRIIAINSDANAPIFQACDLGIVGDFHPYLDWILNHCLFSKDGNR